ncbi:MAG: hypothetical protein F4020_09110 [Gammaproteobacteria bacterium]|nr:hypothetical protein [Gammaproteobacteria bacterium]MYH50867.1 hypothetical protein [Gammaproteobacteria bacterium]MYK69655.1 hypothetical protein [Gammaproteobacteria bacterium]
MSVRRLPTHGLKVLTALVAVGTILVSSVACSESDLASSATSAPPEWPLVKGDMVDGRTMQTTISRFKDAVGYGVPQFTRVPIKAPMNTRERRYACSTNLPSSEGRRTDVIARKVGDRHYMVKALPKGTDCDPDALYVDRWVYRGHS